MAGTPADALEDVKTGIRQLVQHSRTFDDPTKLHKVIDGLAGTTEHALNDAVQAMKERDEIEGELLETQTLLKKTRKRLVALLGDDE